MTRFFIGIRSSFLFFRVLLLRNENVKENLALVFSPRFEKHRSFLFVPDSVGCKGGLIVEGFAIWPQSFLSLHLFVPSVNSSEAGVRHVFRRL